MRQAVLPKLNSSRCEDEYATFDSDTMLCVEPKTPGMCPGARCMARVSLVKIVIRRHPWYFTAGCQPISIGSTGPLDTSGSWYLDVPIIDILLSEQIDFPNMNACQCVFHSLQYRQAGFYWLVMLLMRTWWRSEWKWEAVPQCALWSKGWMEGPAKAKGPFTKEAHAGTESRMTTIIICPAIPSHINTETF